MFDKQPEFQMPQHIMDRVRGAQPVRTAVVGTGHVLAMRSALEAMRAGMIEPILVGPADKTRGIANELGWDLNAIELVDASGDTEIAARGVALARENKVSVIMKGHVHTNALMAAVVARDTGLRTGQRITHAFYLTVRGNPRGLVITDAALNVAPTIEEKVDIAVNAVHLMRTIGLECPNVAVLSGTEEVTPKIPSSVEAETVAIRVRAKLGDSCRIAGPLAMDVAISRSAAEIKGVTGPVAGAADILIVPNLEAGNILYKALVYAVDATAAGLIMGARVPIVLTSRADPPAARLTALALARLVSATKSA